MCFLLALLPLLLGVAPGLKVTAEGGHRTSGPAGPPGGSGCSSDEVGLRHRCLAESGRRWRALCGGGGALAFQKFDECRLALGGMDLSLPQMRTAEHQTHLSVPLARRANTQKPTLYFLGDSLIRNLFKAFCYLLDPVAHNLSMVVELDTIVSCKNENATAVLFFSHSSWLLLGQGVRSIVGAGYPQATDIVLASGFHCLHLSPVRRWSYDSFRDWTRYESDLKQTLAQVAKAAPGAQIAVRTSNFLCKAKLYGAYRDVADSGEADPARAAGPCVGDLTALGVAATDAERACRQGFFTLAGVTRLNDQVRRVVDDLRSPSVRVMDAFHLTDGQCEHTDVGDGRHYNTLILNETDLLFDSLGWPAA